MAITDHDHGTSIHELVKWRLYSIDYTLNILIYIALPLLHDFNQIHTQHGRTRRPKKALYFHYLNPLL